MARRLETLQASSAPLAAAAPLALVAGGGSGGHVFPGLAIADELGKRGWRVSWAGSRRGLEARLVGRHDLPFHPLPSRPLRGQGLAGKARAAAALAQGAWGAWRLVRREAARVVVGTGGYASAPAVLGARLAARPALIVEPNADAGMANRWLSRFASEAAVAYDETAGQLRCPARTTGVPIRDEFFAAGELPPAPPLRLLVLGGSQGARQLNELLPPALARLTPAGEIVVVHQAGAKILDEARTAYAAAGLPSTVRVEVVSFLEDMPAAVRDAHLVISRGGAITLAEICASGRPSLLVPLGIAGGHQIDNARRLATAGAAEMLRPGAAGDDFHALLGTLLADRQRLGAMSRAARGLAREGAAAAIADRVEHLAQEAA